MVPFCVILPRAVAVRFLILRFRIGIAPNERLGPSGVFPVMVRREVTW
jgi:hypothetical protein